MDAKQLGALTPRSFNEVAAQTASTPAIKIDDDVPMPMPRGGGGKGVASTLRALAVGQSFVAPPHLRGITRTQQNTQRVAATIKGKKFATRVVVENEQRVVRVWRTA